MSHPERHRSGPVSAARRGWSTWALGAPLVFALGFAAPAEADNATPGAPADRSPGPERKRSDKTGIQVAVTPADVEVFVDDEKRGAAGDLSFIALKPGAHTLRLVRGGDEVEAEISIERGQVVEFRYDFD